jgi:phage-related minor tail protein
MAETEDEADALAEALDALETRLGATAGVAAGFDAELRRIHETFSATGKGAQRLESALSRGLRRAIDGAVFDGLKLSEALGQVGRALVDAAYSAAVRPVTDHVAGLVTDVAGGVFGGMTGFGKGAGFAQGRVMPFANGGVVQQATRFPMRGGWGLMGEAGPEAILPLARGADGRLGVQSSGAGRPVSVTVNVATPDVEGFRRSRTQIAAEVGRALARGQRNR